jgi:hypothetical protein
MGESAQVGPVRLRDRTDLLKLDPPYQLDSGIELIPDTLVVWLNGQSLLEVRHRLRRPENGEVRDAAAVEGFGVLRVDGDRLGYPVSLLTARRNLSRYSTRLATARKVHIQASAMAAPCSSSLALLMARLFQNVESFGLSCIAWV